MLKKKIADFGLNVAMIGFGLSLAAGGLAALSGMTIGTALVFADPALSKKQSQDLLNAAKPLPSAIAYAFAGLVSSIALGLVTTRDAGESDQGEFQQFMPVASINPAQARTVPTECKTCAFYNPESTFYPANSDVLACTVHPKGKPYLNEICPDFERKPEKWFVVQIRGGTHGGFYLQHEKYAFNFEYISDRPLVKKWLCDRLQVKNVNQCVGKAVSFESQTVPEMRIELNRLIEENRF